MCDCVDVGMGTYDNQVVLPYPPHMSKENGFTKTFAGIDRCLEKEIKYLWSLGIPTIESCCGHNLCMGYISVKNEQNEKKMRDLGYKHQPNSLYPERTDAFDPKYL